MCCPPPWGIGVFGGWRQAAGSPCQIQAGHGPWIPSVFDGEALHETDERYGRTFTCFRPYGHLQKSSIHLEAWIFNMLCLMQFAVVNPSFEQFGNLCCCFCSLPFQQIQGNFITRFMMDNCSVAAQKAAVTWSHWCDTWWVGPAAILWFSTTAMERSPKTKIRRLGKTSRKVKWWWITWGSCWSCSVDEIHSEIPFVQATRNAGSISCNQFTFGHFWYMLKSGVHVLEPRTVAIGPKLHVLQEQKQGSWWEEIIYAQQRALHWVCLLVPRRWDTLVHWVSWIIGHINGYNMWKHVKTMLHTQLSAQESWKVPSVVVWLVAITHIHPRLKIPAEDIGVITPYQLQCERLKNLCQAVGIKAKIGTTELFQGDEKRIILISKVRSQQERFGGVKKSGIPVALYASKQD